MFDYTREQVLEALKANFGRDIWSLDENRIRNMRANPLLSDNFMSLEKCRKFYAERPLYSIPFSLFKRFEADGDRTQFEYSERGYFMHRGHLKTWALSALLGGGDDDISRLEDTIWAICDEYTWALPAHMSGDQGIYASYQPDRYTIDLFAAETGQALSEIIKLLGKRLNPLVTERARREIKARITDRYLYSDMSDFWWYKSTNNWAAVCAGSVGMASICEIEDEEKLADVIMKTLVSMRSFMSGFTDDGVCLEGMGYWHYGFGYFCYYADMLSRRTGGKIDLFSEEKTKKVALFPFKMFFYGSRTVSFSDGGSRGGIGAGFISFLSEKYGKIDIPAGVNMTETVDREGCHRFARDLRSFIWCPSERPTETDGTRRIYTFDCAQWYVANGKDNFGVAAKAGNNNEPHNHNDIGHFITFKNGNEFFCDLGSGEYSKQYFGRERYTFPHCGSQGHSVPIINGKFQAAGKDSFAEDVKVTDRGMAMELRRAYREDSLVSLTRKIDFDPEIPRLTVTDSFRFAAAPESFVERFVTKADVSVGDGEIVLSAGDDTMKMSFDAALFSPSVSDVETADHDGRPLLFRCVDLALKAPGTDGEFSFVIS